MKTQLKKHHGPHFIPNLSYQWFSEASKLGGRPSQLAIALQAWSSILQKRKVDGYFEVSITRIGHDLGIKRATISDALKFLEIHQFVEVKRQSGYKTKIRILKDGVLRKTNGKSTSTKNFEQKEDFRIFQEEDYKGGDHGNRK